MLKNIITIVMVSSSTIALSQIGIGISNPKAALDITSSRSGISIPHIPCPQTAIAAPTESEMVWDTTRKCFKFYSDGVWHNMPGCGIDGSSAEKAALSCKAIKDDFPASVDGVYWLDIDGCGTAFAPAQAQCDMTIDGGGWTQVLNYNHALNTDPPLKVLPAGTFPLLGSMVTGIDESASTTTWGHTITTTLNAMSFKEVRFFGQGDYTGGHTISFKTALPAVVSYIKTGSGSMAGIANTSNYTYIDGTTPPRQSGIPGGATSSWANRGQGAMTDWPFWRVSQYGWAIRGTDPPFQKWVAGNFVQNNTVSPATHHIIWVR